MANVKVSSYVAATIISNTAIGISWEMPSYEGGDSVSKYSIQWDTRYIL